jgi:hypothetical protein
MCKRPRRGTILDIHRAMHGGGVRSVLILAREHDVDVTVAGRGHTAEGAFPGRCRGEGKAISQFPIAKKEERTGGGQIITAMSCLPYRIGSSGRVLIRARCEPRTPQYRTERVLFSVRQRHHPHAHTRRHPASGGERVYIFLPLLFFSFSILPATPCIAHVKVTHPNNSFPYNNH